MQKKHTKLTNEKLAKQFDNAFDLVNIGIGMAHALVNSGRTIEGRDGIYNQGHHILSRIRAGEREISPEELIPLEEESVHTFPHV